LLTDLPLQREYTVLADGMNRLCPLTLHLTQPLLFSSSSGRKAEFNGVRDMGPSLSIFITTWTSTDERCEKGR